MSSTYGRPRTLISAWANFSRTADSAGNAIIASPTQFVARIRIFISLLFAARRVSGEVQYQSLLPNKSQAQLWPRRPEHHQNPKCASFVRLFLWLQTR